MGTYSASSLTRSTPFWLFALLAGGCESLWSGTLVENPHNCISNPLACTNEEHCNEVTEACEKPPDCSRSAALCASNQYCDPASHRCLATTCVQEPTQCQATQACNPATGQCETRTFVLGQPDAISNLNLAYGMYAPRAVLLIPGSAGKTKLLVADSNNQRVLIWNEVPTANRPADAENVAGP